MAIKPLQFKTSTFNSPNVDGLRLMKRVGFHENIRKPIIMNEKLSLNNRTLAEFSSKDLGNGLTFESYNANGDTIKLIQNSQGDFLAFKTNIEHPLDDKHRLLNNMKATILDKFASFSRSSSK